MEDQQIMDSVIQGVEKLGIYWSGDDGLSSACLTPLR